MQRFIVTLLLVIAFVILGISLAEDFLIHGLVGFIVIIVLAFLVTSVLGETDSEPGRSGIPGPAAAPMPTGNVSKSPIPQPAPATPPALPPVEGAIPPDRNAHEEPKSGEAVDDLIDYWENIDPKAAVPGAEIDDDIFLGLPPLEGEEDLSTDPEPSPLQDVDAGPVTTPLPDLDTDEYVFSDIDSGGQMPLPPPAASAPPAPPQPHMPAPSAPPVGDIQRDSDKDEELEAPASEGIQFSAYCPREVKPQNWESLHAYVYRESAFEQVRADVQKVLGEKLAAFRQTVGTASQPIEEGAAITATPYLTGFQFNPVSIAIGFYKQWHRFDFEMRATDADLYQASNGRITFTVEGVIVAEVPISVYVSDHAAEIESVVTTQKMYEAVFASYSHNDTTIVERVERAYKALGLDYLRDVTTLKSGQHWSEEVLDLIKRADIFQLFWSERAAESAYVQQEWQHALKLNRENDSFIRPVYWQQPIPPVPEALKHLHFAYMPELADD